jgi:hypothetical protein
MPDMPHNKYRSAIEILQRGRDLLVESLADDVLDQQENLLEGGFQFHEFLESQGARLHFLGLLMGHLEQSAEFYEDLSARKSQEMARSSGEQEQLHPRRRSKGRGGRSPKPRKQPPPNSEEAVDDIPF